MRVYHQCRRLCISSIRKNCISSNRSVWFMHGFAVMIYKLFVLDDIQRHLAFDDMPNLATLRFG